MTSRFVRDSSKPPGRDHKEESQPGQMQEEAQGGINMDGMNMGSDGFRD